MNACSPIDPPPSPPVGDGNLTKFIVLIKRNECNFDIKVITMSCHLFFGGWGYSKLAT